jgi:tyrosinase
MNERKNVYQLPAGDATLEWYSKAIVEMKKRPTTDPTSWNYQAAIHGFYAASPFWKRVNKPLPNQTGQRDFWKQCQHGSWFFLPWHRMYLAYFEQIVAQTIVDLGGPQGWSLPFWNYSDSTNPNALTIPPAFTGPNNATNGLWIAGRVRNTIPEKYVSLKPLNNPSYTGDGRTSTLGFGGPETAFSHSGATHGGLEGSIHDNVHGIIGGAMGDPRTAGLDPIFWLHHANIDRLWQVWLNMGNRTNPAQSSWLNFKFSLHDKNGNIVDMTCSGVEGTRNVLSGYTYQGVAPGAQVLEHDDLLQKADFSMPLEITAATNKRLTLTSQKTVVQLKLTPSRRNKVNFAAINEALSTPQTSILHFENITGKGVPPIYDVYLNVPEDDGNKESYYAGSLSFFGVEEASLPSLHHSGNGQHYALDISELLNKLRSLSNWNEQQLDISIEPTRDMDKDTSVTIGRISLYSE